MFKTVRKSINKLNFISFWVLLALLASPVVIFAADDTLVLTTEKEITETIEKAAEKAVEKAAEKALEKPLEQEERPEKWRGPTKINYLVYVVDIDSIDGANQSFSANFYVSIRWHDKRLAEDVESIRQLPLNKVWNPRLLIVNQGGRMWESLPNIVEVTPDGTVTYRQRYIGPLTQPLVLSE